MIVSNRESLSPRLIEMSLLFPVLFDLRFTMGMHGTGRHKSICLPG